MSVEFSKSNIGELFGLVSKKVAGSLGDGRYDDLENSKDLLPKITSKEKRTSDVINGHQLKEVYKKIIGLKLIDGLAKLESIESITDNLFDIISGLNIDLELSDETSEEYQHTLQLLAVAFYMYEQLLHPLAEKAKADLAAIVPEPAEEDEKDVDNLSADKWIQYQNKDFVRKKATFETKLQFKHYEKKKIPTGEQRAVEEELIELFIQMSADSKFREETAKAEIEELKLLIAAANTAGEVDKAKELQVKADQLQIDVDKYVDFGVKIFGKKGINGCTDDGKLEQFITEWGLNEYREMKESLNVDEMTPTQVVDYVIHRELKFWEDLDIDSDDEFVRKLIKKLKWEMGWESNTTREGAGGGYWASLEGRENMVRLQVFAVQAWVLRGKPYAEGDRTKLFEALEKFKLSREQLILATTENPTIGKYLSKVLEICQDLPTLRSGSLPKKADFAALGVDETIKRKTKDGRPGGEILPLSDRVVERIVSFGPPLVVKRVMLSGDQYTEVKNKETGEVLSRTFVNGEPMLKDDYLILEANSKFTYESLSGNLGKEVAKSMQKDVMAMVADDPERFGLEASDIPEGSKKELVKFFAEMLFYSFPFLTYILSKCQERTQTAAHGKDLDEKFDWGLVFSPLGKAIHDSDRYGDFVSWMWLMIYYKELTPGHFGAGGQTERLNEFRNLLIAHQRALFGNAVDSFVGKIDILDQFGESEMLSPYKMLVLAPKESVRLMGYAEDKATELTPDQKADVDSEIVGTLIIRAKDGEIVKDGKVWRNGEYVLDKEDHEILVPAEERKRIKLIAGKDSRGNIAYMNGTLDEPYAIGAGGTKVPEGVKPQPANSFDLMNVAISGWLKLLQGIIKGIPQGSVTSETLKGKGESKGDVGDLLGVIAGTIKMYETEATSREGTPFANFDVLEGFTKYPMFHKVLRLFHASRSNDEDGRKKMFQALTNQLRHAVQFGGLGRGHSQQMTLWILDRVLGKTEIGGKPEKKYAAKRDFEGMNAGLAPRETLGNSERKHDVIEYLRLLWEWKSKYSVTEDGQQVTKHVLGEFPLSESSDSKFGFMKPEVWLNPILRNNPDVIYFSKMALRQIALESPLSREGIETKSSKEDKEK